MGSLLGYLAPLLAAHPENVATAGLTFVLQHQVARESLGRFLTSCGAAHIAPLDYSAQEGGDGSGIPDVVGRAPDGNERVLLEAKFWAGLTDHQPVSYLKRLGPDGVLAFIVPSSRLTLVWAELLRRLADATIVCTPKQVDGTWRSAQVGTQPVTLLLVTWDALLRHLTDAVVQAGDQSLVGDIRQLDGLCQKMAADGFTPLLAEELTDGLWRRFAQLSQLVPEIGRELASQGVAKTVGRVSSAAAWTKQPLKIHDVGVELYFDAASCHEVYPTPFWLLLPSAAREHVAEFATSEPRLLFDDEGKPYLALPIRSGVERGDIIKDVVDRCRLVADKLKTAPAAAVPDAADTESDEEPVG